MKRGSRTYDAQLNLLELGQNIMYITEGTLLAVSPMYNCASRFVTSFLFCFFVSLPILESVNSSFDHKFLLQYFVNIWKKNIY